MAELNSTSLVNDVKLVSYYRLEGNSNDSKGTNNGTDTNITYGTNYGKFGQGALFNGTSSTIVPTISSGLSNDFSINLWVNFNNLPASGAQQFIICSYASYKNYWIDVQIDNSGGTYRLIFNLYDGSNLVGITWNISPTLTTGAWHMVTAVRDHTNTTLHLYYDGTEVGTPVTDTTTAPSYTSFIMGDNEFNDAFGGNWLDADLDDVAIFSRVLTVAEISTLYNAGPTGRTYASNRGLASSRGLSSSRGIASRTLV